jgi:hypothetical protein
VGKVLVLVGLGIAGVGLLVLLGFPLGRLPGDIVVRREHVSFYLPVTTSVLLSLLLSLLVALFRR